MSKGFHAQETYIFMHCSYVSLVWIYKIITGRLHLQSRIKINRQEIFKTQQKILNYIIRNNTFKFNIRLLNVSWSFFLDSAYLWVLT